MYNKQNRRTEGCIRSENDRLLILCQGSGKISYKHAIPSLYVVECFGNIMSVKSIMREVICLKPVLSIFITEIIHTAPTANKIFSKNGYAAGIVCV